MRDTILSSCLTPPMPEARRKSRVPPIINKTMKIIEYIEKYPESSAKRLQYAFSRDVQSTVEKLRNMNMVSIKFGYSSESFRLVRLYSMRPDYKEILEHLNEKSQNL